MITLSQKREVGEFRKRYRWMALFAVMVFLGLLMRVGYLQLVQGDRWTLAADDNITRTVSLPAARGIIRDTHGEVIALNRPSYNVLVTPSLLRPVADLDRIALLMELSPDEQAGLRQRVQEVPSERRSHQIETFTDISREQLAALETHLAELPALDIVTVPLREYPFGVLGAHAVGYLNQVNADDLREPEAVGVYRAGDRIGRSGLERRYESLLRGSRGFRRVVVDARGEAQQGFEPRSVDMLRKSVAGHDLRLTFDMRLMSAFDAAFRNYPSGAAVVVDVHTGAVRALYSKPAYDPNEMSSGLSTARYAELTADPFRPLIDKTLYETYFPGSTFKPVTALAALEEGTITPAQRIECLGSLQIGRQRFRCNHRHGWVDLHQAIVRSCNVFFWEVAQELGFEPINYYAADMGFGSPTGIGFNSEAKGFLATREWYIKHYGAFRPGYTLNTAIGQGNTRVTVLQLAMAYAALANGGTLYAPQVVERTSAPDGSLSETFRPRVRRQLAVSADHLELMMRALADVVNDPNGTAYRARRKEGPLVAGKTGTAQVIGRKGRDDGASTAWYIDRSHGWFAGFAPADDPQVAIAVLVEHGGSGSASAAPIATSVLEQYLQRAPPSKSP